MVLKVTKLVCFSLMALVMLILVACQSANEDTYHEITYDFLVEGIGVQVINVLEGQTMNPPSITRYGFVLTGWYLEKSFINQYDFKQPVTRSKNLFAKWVTEDNNSESTPEPSKDEFTIEFDNNGGEGIVKLTVFEGDFLELPTPTKTGYVFVGWYLDLNFTEPFVQTYLSSDVRVVAKWVVEIANSENYQYGAFTEALFATWPETSLKGVKVYYSLVGKNNWTLVDEPLIRLIENDKARVDIVGLKSDTYEIKIINSLGQTFTSTPIITESFNRSGYAHFNSEEGVGAYNNDGTLKENAIVVYITDENKDSLIIPGLPQVGIGWILNNNQYQNSSSNTFGLWSINETIARFNRPISFRFIGTVNVPQGVTQWNSTDNGGSRGDNGDLVRIRDGNNITIQGIGEDAMIYGWGFHLIAATPGRGTSFEVRNLTFKNYSEDAVGLEGMQTGSGANRRWTSPVERGWIHQNTFLPGFHPNPAEPDKSVGDGSLDIKRGQFFTIAYNQFLGTSKTTLIGGTSSDLTFHVTFHHNLYQNVRSRMPLTRAANIHMYNNVFEFTNDNLTFDSSTVLDAREDAFIFSEANFFIGIRNPFRIGSRAQILSHNDILISTQGNHHQITATSRTQTISTTNWQGNFHINPELFYFCPTEKKTQVTRITDAITARAEVMAFSGVFEKREAPTEIRLHETEPTLITEDSHLFVTEHRHNGFDAVLVFEVLEPVIFSMEHTRNEMPVLLTIYGNEIFRGTNQARLEPGIYVIESNLTHGRQRSGVYHRQTSLQNVRIQFV